MSGCGCQGSCARFDGLAPAYRRALWIVIALNGAMFVIEMLAGAMAGSKALQADALDFLGDTLTYGLSLWAIGRSVATRANAALVKAFSLAGMGLWVLGSTLWRLAAGGLPEAPVMGGVGLLALAVNLGAVLILSRWKDGDANVRSVWLCSRNDALGNLAVIGAALAVAVTGSRWPDLIVALAMAGLFLHSALTILRQALAEHRVHPA